MNISKAPNIDSVLWVTVNTIKGGKEGLSHHMAKYCSPNWGWSILRIRSHVQQIQLEKEEGPALSLFSQLQGLLPWRGWYVGTSWWTDADDASIIRSSVVSDPTSDHTASGTPTHIKDCSSMGEGDPPISVTGMLPRLLEKTWAGGTMWQHMCSIESPEFKDTLLIARTKKGSEHTPEEHTIQSCALKHKKAQACASKPTPFMIQPGIMKELTSMMQTWSMNEVACPPAVRQEPDNTLNL